MLLPPNERRILRLLDRQQLDFRRLQAYSNNASISHRSVDVTNSFQLILINEYWPRRARKRLVRSLCKVSLPRPLASLVFPITRLAFSHPRDRSSQALNSGLLPFGFGDPLDVFLFMAVAEIFERRQSLLVL